MTRFSAAAILCATSLLGACSTVVPRSTPGEDLVGRTVRVETSRGQVSTLLFMRDGTVQAAFGEAKVKGRWELEPGRLCFLWGSAPRECWPYAEPFRRGQTVDIESDRGNRLRATML